MVPPDLVKETRLPGEPGTRFIPFTFVQLSVDSPLGNHRDTMTERSLFSFPPATNLSGSDMGKIAA